MVLTTNFVCVSNMNKYLFNAIVNCRDNIIWVFYICFLCQISDIASHRKNCITERETVSQIQDNQYLIVSE